MIKVRLNLDGNIRSFHIESKLVEIFDNDGKMINYTNYEGSEVDILKDILNKNIGAKIEMLEIE